MADTQFIDVPVDGDPSYEVFRMPTNRPAQYLAWESSADYCRIVTEVDNSEGLSSILPGTVLTTEAGEFKGILFGQPVQPGRVEMRTVTHQGPCIVRREKLIFPTVADVAANPGANPPVVAVDGETATELLKIELEAALAAAGIEIQ